MYKKLKSKEDILNVAKELVKDKGFSELNIRALASACNVSTGTIYNYFPSKKELVVETVEMIWRGVFHQKSCDFSTSSFVSTLEWFEDCLKRGAKAFPNFMSQHNNYFSANEKKEGKKQMDFYFHHIAKGMKISLRGEKKICYGLKEDGITQHEFIEFVVWSMVDNVMNNRKSTTLMQMVKGYTK